MAAPAKEKIAPKKQPLLVHAENLPDYARRRNELFLHILTAGCWLIYRQKLIGSF